MYGNIIQQNAVAQKEKENIKKQEEASKQEEQMSRASGVGRARQERKLPGRAPLNSFLLCGHQLALPLQTDSCTIHDPI
jgi:hypothetical protein